MLRRSSFLIVFALSCACVADNITFLRLDKSVVQQRLQELPQSPAERVPALKKMFEKAGCARENIEVQPIPGQPLPNVLCTVPGTEFGTILIAARLDFDGRGEEGPVGWGGVVMLPLLAESLTSTSHRHTLVFAAFSGGNMAGAATYWKNLSDAQRIDLRGMVDLDHLGRTDAGYLAPANGTVMARLLPAAARALQLAAEPRPVPEIPESDAALFERAHIPAITIYSHGYVSSGLEAQPASVEANPLVPEDVRKIASSSSRSFALKTGLDPEVYNRTYNLLCVYVLFLDRGLSASKRSAANVLRAESAPPLPIKPAESSAVAATTVSSASDNPSNVTAASDATSRKVAAAAAAPPMPARSPAVAQASAAPPGNSLPATIRVSTRLVQFDVVVTDNHGHPVKDLRAADFTVLQDGQAQTVRAFEVHSPAVKENPAGAAAVSVQSASAASPSNSFSNIPAKAPQSNWTIVLFDILNTGVADQAYARSQLLKLLKAVPRGEPVALFVLTRQLEMLQGFTQDPDQLVRMAEMLDPSKSQLLTTMVERERTVSAITSTAQQAAPQSGAPIAGPGFNTDSIAYSQAARIAQGYNDHEAFRTTDRVVFTLEAMKGMARAVSGYPGRKNLVWLSGSFPIQIEPDPASTDAFRNMRGFEGQVRATASLLATSRVAVYPVDVRGLQSQGIDISVATAENQVMTNVAPEAAHGVVASSPSALGSSMTAESVARADDRVTMKSIAEQTGGEAFVNTNDLSRVINRSLDDGSTYYTLAYTPPKEDADGGYHRVVVKVPSKSLKLAYRRGYYSVPQPTQAGAAGTAALRAALQPGMPPATSMLLTAAIELPDASRTDVTVNYVIDSNSVDFGDAPGDKKRAQIDCMIIAFDSSGKEVAHASDTLDATIPANIYATVLTYGLPAHQLIALPPGKYNLRIGVMDRTTQQIGTVDAPLLVPGPDVAQR